MWPFRSKPKLEKPKGPALACVHHGVCSKELCPMWVSFDLKIEGKLQHQPNGKCAVAWTPQLLIELREELVKASKVKPGAS